MVTDVWFCIWNQFLILCPWQSTWLKWKIQFQNPVSLQGQCQGQPVLGAWPNKYALPHLHSKHIISKSFDLHTFMPFTAFFNILREADNFERKKLQHYQLHHTSLVSLFQEPTLWTYKGTVEFHPSIVQTVSQGLSGRRTQSPLGSSGRWPPRP